MTPKDRAVKAAEDGNLNLVKTLIEQGVSLNARDKHGEPLLIGAAARGRLDVMVYLVEAGAEVDISNNYKKTALMLCCIGNDQKAVRLLLQHGADPMRKDTSGKTAMNYAMDARNVEILQIFVDFEKEKNQKPLKEKFIENARIKETFVLKRRGNNTPKY